MSKTNRYFAVVGKNKELSCFELRSLGADLEGFYNGVQVFRMTDEQFNRFVVCNGGSIKRGVLIDEAELASALKDTVIVGVSHRELGKKAKKLGVRRYKEIDLQKTDLEIKQKGKELIEFDGQMGLITGWQEIDRNAAIDFDKPFSGMQVGMMPAKLTQTLIGIGLGVARATKSMTIYDPFCGFGTTGFVANALGYDTINSDINPTPMKQNIDRREGTQRCNADKRVTVFKHDVLEPFTQPFLKHASVVVTEGRLGPVMSQKAINQFTRIQFSSRQEEIVAVYKGFISNLHAAQPDLPVVITFPQRTFIDENMAHGFIKHCEELGYTVEQAGDVYKRKKQNVGRRVLVLTA